MKKFLLSVLCLFSAVTIYAQTDIISNSSFEDWNGGKPTDWATLTTSNATIEQSTDAHTGNSSVVVKGATGNKRIASKSYTIEAGTYKLSAFVKANGSEAGYYRIGYVKLKDGIVVDSNNDYIYSNNEAAAAPAEWTETTFEFTLAEETELAVIVMNNKKGNKASFLLDDMTLAKAEATEPGEGEGEGEGEDGGDTEVTFTTIAEVLAAGAGNAATKGTVVATYSRGFLMNDGTGSILVYQGSDKGFVAGDVVTVSGSTSTYGGLLQFGNTAVVEKTGTATVEHPAATKMDGAAMDAYVTAPETKFVEYTGTLTIDGNYYNVAVDGASTAIGSIQYPNTGLVTATSGNVVKVTGYAIGVSSSKYVNTMAISVEVVEGEPGEGEGGEDVELETITIEEVIDNGAGKAKTQATIVATYAKGFLLDDGTGSILVYLGTTHEYVAGDYVTVEGTTSMYGGILQFGAGAVVEKTNTVTFTLPAPQEMLGEDMDAYLTSPTVAFVEYTGTLTINGNYYNVEVEGATKSTGSIQYPNTGLVTAKSGDVIKVTGYVIGVSGSKFVNTMAVSVEVIESSEPVEVKEYTVAEALAAYVEGQKTPAIVTGYIVGAMNSDSYEPEFGTTTEATNILIADNADESDAANCLIVQLPAGDIRSTLNLVDTPSNYKMQIKITGSIEVYFRAAGLKTPTAFEFTGVTGIEEVIGEEEGAKAIYDLTGRRVNEITKAGIYIVNGKKVLVK